MENEAKFCGQDDIRPEYKTETATAADLLELEED